MRRKRRRKDNTPVPTSHSISRFLGTIPPPTASVTQSCCSSPGDDRVPLNTDKTLQLSSSGKLSSSSDIGSFDAPELHMQFHAPSAQAFLPITSSARKPTRTLQLNPNGKLLSSPTREQTDSGSDCSVKSKRRRKSKHHIVVSFKYGSDDQDSRVRIGNAINRIFSDTTPSLLVKLPISSEKLPAPKTQPLPKQTHPFFLSKPKPQPAPQGGSPITNTTSLNHPKHTWQGSSGNFPSRSMSSFNTFKTFDPIEPIWPPREATHVRGIEPKKPVQVPPSQYRNEKSKKSQLTIGGCEDIIQIECDKLSRLKNLPEQHEEILRPPEKVSYTRDDLEQTVLDRLFCLEKHSTSQSLHPALSRLLDAVPTATNAFERIESDDLPWPQKYAPVTSDHVLQPGLEAQVLTTWLQHLTVNSVDTGAVKKAPKRNIHENKKKAKRPKGLDNFIASSENEGDNLATMSDDELAGDVAIGPRRTVVRIDDNGPVKNPPANAILISGPSGCGKTAAVYAIAKQLGFEVFEINPGSRRSAKDISDRVGDMTQNHLVRLSKDKDGSPGIDYTSLVDSEVKSETGTQSTMADFFKGYNRNKSSSSSEKPFRAESEVEGKTSHRQSLLLFEEADILFEEDRQFWSCLLSLIDQSKRPVVITCNDERLLPLNDLKLHAILRFQRPPCDLAADYMLIVAALEGHLLNPDCLCRLYLSRGQDLRAAMMQLSFWCQVGVGSEKAGLDWLPDRHLFSEDPHQRSSAPRAISVRTYVDGMGWYNRDLAMDQVWPQESRATLIADSLDQWNFSLMDWEETEAMKDKSQAEDEISRLEALDFQSWKADMRSCLDTFSGHSLDSPLQVRKSNT